MRRVAGSAEALARIRTASDTVYCRDDLHKFGDYAKYLTTKRGAPHHVAAADVGDDPALPLHSNVR